jgi:hypothetical protein
MPKLEVLDLDAKPRQVLTTHWNTFLTISKINIAGGRVTGMAEVSGQHRRWRLSIQWPEPKRRYRLGCWC